MKVHDAVHCYDWDILRQQAAKSSSAHTRDEFSQGQFNSGSRQLMWLWPLSVRGWCNGHWIPTRAKRARARVRAYTVRLGVTPVEEPVDNCPVCPRRPSFAAAPSHLVSCTYSMHAYAYALQRGVDNRTRALARARSWAIAGNALQLAKLGPLPHRGRHDLPPRGALPTW
jgi:hypothetical protein